MYWFPGVGSHAGAPKAETFVKMTRWPRQLVSVRTLARQKLRLSTSLRASRSESIRKAIKSLEKALKSIEKAMKSIEKALKRH